MTELSGEPPAPFIVGVGRSGTTLLRLMLDAHSELAIPGETHFLPMLLALDGQLTAERFLEEITTSSTWSNLVVDTRKLAAALAAIQPFSVSDAVRTFYRLYAGLFGKARWGDKSPTYRSHMTTIAKFLPEAHFLHIVRDGRDVALSYKGLWFGPGGDIEAQAHFWVDQIRSAREQARQLTHYAELRYEALVSDTEATLKRVCGFLQLPFEPAMLEYYQGASRRLGEMRQPFGPSPSNLPDAASFLAIHERTSRSPDPSRIGRWKLEMSAEDQQRYEAIAGDLLQELGYETRFLRERRSTRA